MNYEALKSQFDWLMEGGRDVAQHISENMGAELRNMELFLRYVQLLVVAGRTTRAQ
jgi:hypothetical protein